MKALSIARIFAIMSRFGVFGESDRFWIVTDYRLLATECCISEILRVLREGVPGQSGAFADFLYANAYGVGAGGIGGGFAQHSELAEHLAVHLGHQVILAVLVVAPNL